MKHAQFSQRRRQVLALGAAAAALAPAAARAGRESGALINGGKVVVSGRVVGTQDGKPLAGAQIEIWRVDARGVRAAAAHEVITADGDGRYFAALKGHAQCLQYRVSHKGYGTRLAQLRTDSHTQRSVTLTRDDSGVTRAAFEIKLAPGSAVDASRPDVLVL